MVIEDEDAENALREANAFDNAQKIRAYAKVYHEKYSSLFIIRPSFKEHYSWLIKCADWLDPLVEKDYDQFLHVCDGQDQTGSE